MSVSAVNAEFRAEILSALNDDLNSSLALASLDNFINFANEYLDKNPKDKVKKAEFMANLGFVAEILGILQINENEYFQFGVSDEDKAKIAKFIAQRSEAKKEKNFALADEIRENLTKMGISIMDTPSGTIWEVIIESDKK